MLRTRKSDKTIKKSKSLQFQGEIGGIRISYKEVG